MAIAHESRFTADAEVDLDFAMHVWDEAMQGNAANRKLIGQLFSIKIGAAILSRQMSGSANDRFSGSKRKSVGKVASFR